jgi:hypothetical protein
MDVLEIITKAWPIFVGFVGLVIVLAKLDLRVAVLEEKVKALFELLNKKP